MPSNNICSIKGCNNKQNSKRSRGHCESHHRRWKAGKELDTPLKVTGIYTICTVPNCGRPHKAKGLCGAHWVRQKNGQDMTIPVGQMKTSAVGSTRISKEGYCCIKVANGSWVRRNRLVMEQYIGRLLEDHETVHHKNGVRDDDRLNNLELWSCSQPSGQRVVDKIKWARNLLDLYGDISSQLEKQQGKFDNDRCFG